MATSPNTGQQLIAGVRSRLRRPSELKLPDKDILEVINDLCQDYVQDMSLAIRDRRTEVRKVTITVPESSDEADFILDADDLPDFEPIHLEVANSEGSTFVWHKLTPVPFDTWATYYGNRQLVCSFYGSSSMTTPAKVKLPFLDEDIARLQFRLSYRLPLLTIIQEGDRPPIPAAHIGMLKDEAAIVCISRVRDDSQEWRDWVKDNLSLMTATLTGRKKRWMEYLNSSVESQSVPVHRSDRAHRSARTAVRPTIPPQP